MEQTEKKPITNIKVLRKAYSKYTKDKQDSFKRDYALVIHDLFKIFNSDSYADYNKQFSKLSATERIICFYGVPIRLSKKEFAVIRLLIEESSLLNDDYNDILSKKIFSRKASNSNLKSFVSKLKKKILQKIKEYPKEDSYWFKNVNDKEVDKRVNDLIYYKYQLNGYALYSNFRLIRPERIKKQYL